MSTREEVAMLDSDAPVIVVGDTHAQREKVERLIETLAATGLLADRRLVFLGDYVDRGPDAKGLLDFCIGLRAEGHVMLMGNHEYILERALFAEDRRDYWTERWTNNYECDVLTSYGVPSGTRTPEGREERARALRAMMPTAHLDFLRGLPWCYEDDTVVAIHAGVDPATAWEEQRAGLHARSTTNPKGPQQLCLKDYAEDTTARVPGRSLVTGHATRTEAYVAEGRVMIDLGADRRGGRLCAWVSDTGDLVEVC